MGSIWRNSGGSEEQRGDNPSLSQAVAVSDAHDQALSEAAWNGFVPDGLLLQGYHTQRAAAVLRRGVNVVASSHLTERLRALDDELEALIQQAPAPPVQPPAPTVLHTVSRTLPFVKGAMRQG